MVHSRCRSKRLREQDSDKTLGGCRLVAWSTCACVLAACLIVPLIIIYTLASFLGLIVVGIVLLPRVGDLGVELAHDL
jgi:hypothetical protein